MIFEKICVLGLGYIGLPTASIFATHGINVVGVDINPKVVDTLNGGGIHIQEVGLDALVQQALSSGKLTVQCQPVPADAFIIAVPTPIRADKTADMSMVISAIEMIVPHLRCGNLIILESTSPPGTTIELVRPILEKSGLKASLDFKLAYSPERVLPGQILKELVENDRVIGGIDFDSAQAGQALYATFVKGAIILTDATTAEMVKLMENTFRDVNIALANEFTLIAEHIGVNVWEAIELANHHPRVKILKPGPGVGGHCIAVDPWFLVESAPQVTPLIRTARDVNDTMPKHVAKLVQTVLANIYSDGRQTQVPVIACLGLAYKANVDDARESPALSVVAELEQLGYQVRVSDPLVKHLHGVEREILSAEEAVVGADCVVLLTDHGLYSTLDPVAIGKLMHQRLVIDTRHSLDLVIWQAAGFQTYLIGNPL